jgi:superfamily II DNA or RNA helicase
MNQMDAKNKKTLVFASTIETCDKIEQALQSEGYDAIAYHSKKSKKESTRILNAFRSNSLYTGSDKQLQDKSLLDTLEPDESNQPKPIKCLISVARLTTGFSVKDIDLGVFISPTKVRSKYIQSSGRLCRTYTGLTDLINKHKDNL